MRLHHVQVCCPVGGEDLARTFYTRVLGMPEIPKPGALADRGGVWFAFGAYELHVGVEEPFVPARKAHPALLVDDLDAVADAVRGADLPVSSDEAIPGVRRFHTFDHHGNRVEIRA